MEQLKELQRLALVNKITTGKFVIHVISIIFHTPRRVVRSHKNNTSNFWCRSSPLIFTWRAAELENHLGISEKTLAEFIVELSKDKTSAKQFGQVILQFPA